MTRFFLIGAAALFVVSCAGINSAFVPEEEAAAEVSPGGIAPLPEPAAEYAVKAFYEGAVEKSAAGFEQMLRFTPNNITVKRQLVRAYYELGDFTRIVPLLEEILSESPGDAEAEQELFFALCLSAQYAKAAALLPLSRPTAETLFYEALLRRDTGSPAEAIKLFRQSLADEEFRPVAWFFLAELLAPTAPKEAEECFKTALRQDSGFTAVLFPLAEALLAQDRYKEAYGFFVRAQNSYPGHTGIAARIEEIRAAHPEMEEERKASAEKRRIEAVPPRVKSLASPSDVQVRIGLAERLASISLKTGGDYTLRAAAGEMFSGKALEYLRVSWSRGTLSIDTGEGRAPIISSGSIILEYASPENTSIVFDFVSEAGSFFAVTEDRSYRGSLEFRPAADGITLINSLAIEDYLYAVIPSEMPASWPAEALKAQAIAHRSYTLSHLGAYASRGFDMYGSVLSAAYRGVGGETASTTTAVDSTRGVFLQAGGKPLKAFYASNHGGYSEDSAAVWGGEDAFMAAVPDRLIPVRKSWLPLDELERFVRTRPRAYSARFNSPITYRWEKWVSADEIAARISGEAGIGKILKIISRGRGISGRVREVEIEGANGAHRVSGDRIRSRLGGLRSNLFCVRPKIGKDGRPEYFIFYGAGWGHGIGLDQSGAAGMAQAGFSAENILLHYYPRAEITSQ
jgi:SpoIID/LytB domain protein